MLLAALQFPCRPNLGPSIVEQHRPSKYSTAVLASLALCPDCRLRRKFCVAGPTAWEYLESKRPHSHDVRAFTVVTGGAGQRALLISGSNDARLFAYQIARFTKVSILQAEYGALKIDYRIPACYYNGHRGFWPKHIIILMTKERFHRLLCYHTQLDAKAILRAAKSVEQI